MGVAAAVAAAAYVPTLSCDFVNIDDPQYVTHNAHVLAPDLAKLGAVFREVWQPSTVAGYYQPLTMASLMLDRLIEGRDAAPRPFVYHLTNVLLHALNVALAVWWVGRCLRGRLPDGAARWWVALGAGLLYGLHPVNVEAVSWVCQRKAVLSTMFALAALVTYDAYARRGGAWRYGVVFAALLLSLLAKPTGWLLPLVLVGLDVWPYARLTARAVVEKLPLAGLSLLAGWVSYVSQRQSMGRARLVLLEEPLTGLLVLAHNVSFYLYKLVCPLVLSPQYPMPNDESQVSLANPRFLAGAVGAIAVCGGVAWAALRRRWDVVVCLGGFLLLMAPVLGAVDFMGAIAADRFLYLPMLMLVLLAASLAGGRLVTEPRCASRAAVLGGVLALALAAKTYAQQGVWRNSVAYWEAARAYAPSEPGLLDGLANAYIERFYHSTVPGEAGRPEDLRAAQALLLETIRLRPSYSRAYFRLAEMLIDARRPADALVWVQRGLAYPDADAEGHFFHGLALARLGRYAEAIGSYEAHLRQRPAHRETLRNLAQALCLVGRWQDAEARYAELTRLDPADGEAFYGLGRARLELNGDAAAIEPFHAAAARKPDDGQVRLALAACLAGCGRDAEALNELRIAVRLRPELMAIAEGQPRFERLRATAAWEELARSAAASTSPSSGLVP